MEREMYLINVDMIDFVFSVLSMFQIFQYLPYFLLLILNYLMFFSLFISVICLLTSGKFILFFAKSSLSIGISTRMRKNC